jgi:hypothetical protein
MSLNPTLREIAWNGYPSSSETCIHWDVVGFPESRDAQVFCKVGPTGKRTYETRLKRAGRWSDWTGSFASKEEALAALKSEFQQVVE